MPVFAEHRATTQCAPQTNFSRCPLFRGERLVTSSTQDNFDDRNEWRCDQKERHQPHHRRRDYPQRPRRGAPCAISQSRQRREARTFALPHHDPTGDEREQNARTEKREQGLVPPAESAAMERDANGGGATPHGLLIPVDALQGFAAERVDCDVEARVGAARGCCANTANGDRV